MGILDWFTGGSTPYRTLFRAMDGDRPWAALIVALGLAVAAGFLVIAGHWEASRRALPDSPARRALGRMRTIFLLAGACTLLVPPAVMAWPAWRLHALALAALAVVTWRYAWETRGLRVIYARRERPSRVPEPSRDPSRRKTDVFNAIGHDLRSPLNGILLQAELAELELDDPEPTDETRRVQREALRSIRADARAAAELLEHLLEFARLQQYGVLTEPGPVDLAAILGRLDARFRPEAERKGLTLQIADAAGPPLLIDGNALERTLANLIDNAVKFTTTGGVEVAVRRSTHDIQIDVVDSGPGIAPENLEHLFDEFYQVRNHERNRANGFGLGLAIARGMAEALGGTIRVDSRPGAGSRFSLDLPGIALPPLRPARAVAPAHR